MLQIITPDLPFQNSFKRAAAGTIIGAFIFPTGFLLGKYTFQIRKTHSLEPLSGQADFSSFIIQNIFYFLASVCFLFVVKFWYSFNTIKHIKQIQYNPQNGSIIIKYNNLLGSKSKEETIRREDLRFHLNTRTQEAEISDKLTAPFVLNSKTGFSFEKLLALQHLISEEVNYV